MRIVHKLGSWCWLKFLASLILATLMTNMPLNAADETPRALKVVNARRVLVICHRGYPQFAPENTIPS